MRVYLLRHGRTAYNDEQRYQGLRDIPLSQMGEEELRPVEEAPETVYVSPLSRARRTAELLFPTPARCLWRGSGRWTSGPLKGAITRRWSMTRPTGPGWRAAARGPAPGGRAVDSSAAGCGRHFLI